MAGNRNPGARVGAAGAGVPCQAAAAGTPDIAACGSPGNVWALRAAPLALLDPATTAAFALAVGRLWGVAHG